MKKLIALLLASGMVAAIPATVLAQADAPDMSAVSSMEPSGMAGATTGVQQFTWSDLLASVNAQASGSSQTDWATLIGGITSDSDVQIIDVFSLEGSPGQSDSSLQAALDSSSEAMSSLQTAISGNQTLVDKLKAQGYAAADVVAVTSNPDSSFSIYVKPAAGSSLGVSSSSALGG